MSAVTTVEIANATIPIKPAVQLIFAPDTFYGAVCQPRTPDGREVGESCDEMQVCIAPMHVSLRRVYILL